MNIKTIKQLKQLKQIKAVRSVEIVTDDILKHYPLSRIFSNRFTMEGGVHQVGKIELNENIATFTSDKVELRLFPENKIDEYKCFEYETVLESYPLLNKFGGDLNRQVYILSNAKKVVDLKPLIDKIKAIKPMEGVVNFRSTDYTFKYNDKLSYGRNSIKSDNLLKDSSGCIIGLIFNVVSDINYNLIYTFNN